MSTTNMVFSLELGKNSKPGTGKQQNEDTIGYYFPQHPEALLLRGQMFMIADGKGEESTGAFASKLAIQTVIQEYFDEPWVGTIEAMLMKAVNSANTMIHDANIENQSISYFSASLTCAVIHQDTLYIAHVGNCCAYLVSGSGFELLTRSHVIDVESGNESPPSRGAQNGSYIVRSLGSDEDVTIDMIQRKMQINDVVLLCTDGVYQAVSEQSLQDIMISATPQQACDLLLKVASENELEDAATALIVRLKSIKRIQEGDELIPPEADASQPPERQITIKGVRYRAPTRVKEIQPAEKQIVEEFSQDRESRRPVARRTGKLRPGFQIPLRQVLNIFSVVVLTALILFFIIKYGPSYWQSVSKDDSQKIQAGDDRAEVIQPPSLEQIQQPQKIEEEPGISYQSGEVITPTVEPEFQTSGEIKLNVILIDGSFQKNITWDGYLQEMKKFSASDDVELMKSTFRLKKSKILWRRASDVQMANTIKERVDQYVQLFSTHFQILPEILPVDFTLVIGADFKLPPIKTGIYREEKERKDYYLEILNGYTLTGLAGRVNQLLHNQPINGSKISVVDFRNADKKSYRVSFIKCEASQNRIAEELKKVLGQPITILNTSLFDIKILVGTDIKL